MLGAEHPATLVAATCVAKVFAAQGQLSEAERLHRETLKVRRRVLGAEHPDTLTSAASLATAFWKQVGELEKATHILRETRDVQKRVLLRGPSAAAPAPAVCVG